MNSKSSNDKTPIPAQSTIPTVSFAHQRSAAEERRQAYPYRFPRDTRQLGGKYSVAENARRLLRFFYFERRLMQALGAWTLSIPEFEVKLETGRHIFYHADAARLLRERLNEQEMRLRDIDDFRDPEIDRFIEEMLSANSSCELLVGMHQVIGRALATAYKHHIDDTDPVTDVPTIRCLRRILSDYEPMLEWAEGAISAYIDGGVMESGLAVWRWHLQRLLSSIGGVTGVDARTEGPTPLRIDFTPFARGTTPMRDVRFDTFKNTGDYDTADEKERFPKDSYESLRLRFIRTQRDEVDAIEAFGTFIWDIRFKDFQSEYNLARITWDEARHTEIGHRALLACGYDPFELRNRLTGSTCRGPMEPAFAMAGIIKVMTDLEAKALELRTRELFTECLVSLGAFNKDMDVFTVSRDDLEHLVGE